MSVVQSHLQIVGSEQSYNKSPSLTFITYNYRGISKMTSKGWLVQLIAV